MGVLSRFSNYIKTVMSAFLDRAEDPGQTLDYSYEKQLEQLQNLRKSIVDVMMKRSGWNCNRRRSTRSRQTGRSGAPGALGGQ